MKNLDDIWKYLCDNGYARSCSQFYCNKSETAKAFWNGMLTALEIEGKITTADASEIWREVEAK